MDERRPSRLRTAERNRLAKLRFLNADTSNSAAPEPVPYIDLSVPGTPVCSKYLAAWRAQETAAAERRPHNPFTTFLESMDKLKAGNLSPSDTDNVLSVLLKLEQQAEANAQSTQSASISDCFGYQHVGTFNGRSNLRVDPSVRRSLSRRASIDSTSGFQSEVVV